MKVTPNTYVTLGRGGKYGTTEPQHDPRLNGLKGSENPQEHHLQSSSKCLDSGKKQESLGQNWSQSCERQRLKHWTCLRSYWIQQKHAKKISLHKASQVMDLRITWNAATNGCMISVLLQHSYKCGGLTTATVKRMVWNHHSFLPVPHSSSFGIIVYHNYKLRNRDRG